MKLTINRTALLSALRPMQQIASKASAKHPSLSCVLIVAEADSVTFHANNLDQSVQIKVKANVTEAGTVALPAKKFQSIVAALAGEDVKLEATGTLAKISAAGSLFKITAANADDFPKETVMPDESQTFTLTKSTLLNRLRSVAFAQSSDENRFILNGVYFQLQKTGLTLVATDGRRLARTVEAFKSAAEGEATLPARAVAEITGHLDGDAEVSVRLNARFASFDFAAEKDSPILHSRIVTKVVEGRYPNYQQVIPKEAPGAPTATFKRTELIDAIKRVSLLTDEKACTVKFNFTADSVILTAASSGIGEAKEVIELKHNLGNLTINFNPTYVGEALRGVPDDEIVFKAKDGESPGVFQSSGETLCVVMPQKA